MRYKRPCLLLSAGLVVATLMVYQQTHPATSTAADSHLGQHGAPVEADHQALAVHKVATIFTILRDVNPPAAGAALTALEAYNHLLTTDRPTALALPAWLALPVSSAARLVRRLELSSRLAGWQAGLRWIGCML